jgi:hypothetical protein
MVFKNKKLRRKKGRRKKGGRNRLLVRTAK